MHSDLRTQTDLKFVVCELSRSNSTRNFDIAEPCIENFVQDMKNLSEQNLKIHEIKMIGGHRILKKDLAFAYVFCLHLMNCRVVWELKSSRSQV